MAPRRFLFVLLFLYVNKMRFQKTPALMNLTAVLALGAIALLVVVFVVTSGVDLVQQGLYDDEYQETLTGADACVEEVVVRLSTDSAYAGEAFTIGSVDCTTSVADAGGNYRTVTVEAVQGALYVSRLTVTVNLNTNPISISNWEES